MVIWLAPKLVNGLCIEITRCMDVLVLNIQNDGTFWGGNVF